MNASDWFWFFAPLVVGFWAGWTTGRSLLARRNMKDKK